MKRFSEGKRFCVGFIAALAVCAVLAQPAAALTNASVVAKAQTYRNGQYGGQCIVWAANVLRSASGGKIRISAYSSGYQGTYRANGAKQVSSAAAAGGDVIQITPPGTPDSWKGPEYPPLHTAIILSNLGGGNFSVIDSNARNDERVLRHNYNPYAGSRRIVKIWRFGSVQTTKPKPPSSGGGVGNSQFLGSDRLAAGQTMKRGQYLLSENGIYSLVFQSDSNLVLYSGGRALWNSHTSGSGADRVVMQGDGNLVMYKGGSAVWNSHTAGKGSSVLVMQSDGNAVVYAGSVATWSSVTGGHPSWSYAGSDRLLNGQALTPGHYLRSSDKRYVLLMQTDGNAVLYGPGYHVLWNAETGGSGADRLVMQGDGNLVIYKGSKALWSSSTAHNGASTAVVQSDGNFVIYRSSDGHVTWSSKTAGRL